MIGFELFYDPFDDVFVEFVNSNLLLLLHFILRRQRLKPRGLILVVAPLKHHGRMHICRAVVTLVLMILLLWLKVTYRLLYLIIILMVHHNFK